MSDGILSLHNAFHSLELGHRCKGKGLPKVRPVQNVHNHKQGEAVVR
jgi:hypothetical protein